MVKAKSTSKGMHFWATNSTPRKFGCIQSISEFDEGVDSELLMSQVPRSWVLSIFSCMLAAVRLLPILSA